MAATGQEAPDIDNVLADWQRTLASIHDQILDMHHRRAIHDGFLELLEPDAHPDTNIFRDTFHRMYVESQALAIRRQTDRMSGTMSLRRLLGNLAYNRKAFTRSWYVERWINHAARRQPLDDHMARFHRDQANDTFDMFTKHPGDNIIGNKVLMDDQAELDRITVAVVSFTNDFIAHTAGTPGEQAVTYFEFNAAIDHLGSMLRKYMLLIDQTGLVDATPTIQGDWMRPFRRALA